jgi:hypothetical protein
MGFLRNSPGFLGTGAGLLADLTLLVELIFYFVLCLGVAAQLLKRYKWHDWLQAPVVVLNLAFIGLVMLPSFAGVLGQLPAGLVKAPILVALLHGALGLTTEAMSIYCLLAGFKILPRKVGTLRYFMWAAFTLWTITIFFGVGVYVVWYARQSTTATAPAEIVAEHDADLPQPTAAIILSVSTSAPTAAPSTPTASPTAVTPPFNPPQTPPPAPAGLATLSDGPIHTDQLTMQLTNLTPPAAGQTYQVWLQADSGPPLNLGPLAVANNAASFTFVDPQGRRLLNGYRGLFITLEPANDPDPAPSATIIFQGEVPPTALPFIRNLVTASAGTPDGDGLALNALTEAIRLVQLAQIQQQYVAQNDLVNLRAHAEAALNVLEGSAGPNFGDPDGDGAVSNPGDGFGLLGFNNSIGYLPAATEQAHQAAAAGGLVALHAGHVEISAANALDWAGQMRDLELQVLQANQPADAAGAAARLVELAAALLEGLDANGNGQVEPIPGEGGIRTLYRHSQLMGSIELFAAAPPPGAEPAAEPTTPSTPTTPPPTNTPAPAPTATPPPPPTPTPTIEVISEHDGA